jgi:hypothetical protein
MLLALRCLERSVVSWLGQVRVAVPSPGEMARSILRHRRSEYDLVVYDHSRR